MPGTSRVRVSCSRGTCPKPGEPDLRTFEWRYLWGVARPRELLTIRSDSAQIWGSATSPDGRLLATGGGDGRIQLWSLPSGGLAATLQAPDARNIVYGVTFSPDGRLLATTANSPVVHLWDVGGRRLLATLGKQTGSVLWVAFSHDGKTLASVAGWPYALDTPAEVTLWDVASHRKLAVLVGHTSSTCRPDFSPDGRLLATPHGNGTILLWDLGSRTIVGHSPATRGWSSACGSHRMVSCWHPRASMAPCGCGTCRRAARLPRSAPTRERCTRLRSRPTGPG